MQNVKGLVMVVEKTETSKADDIRKGRVSAIRTAAERGNLAEVRAHAQGQSNSQ